VDDDHQAANQQAPAQDAERCGAWRRRHPTVRWRPLLVVTRRRRWRLGARRPSAAGLQSHITESYVARRAGRATIRTMADDVQRLKQRACEAVERRSAELIDTANWIHAH